jgi:hypothetical protein
LCLSAILTVIFKLITTGLNADPYTASETNVKVSESSKSVPSDAS